MRIKHKAHPVSDDFLASLTLLRNDPELLNRVLPQARDGNVHAQYAAGLIYAEGRGVAVDRIEAYVWLSRALAQGDQDAGELRNMLLLEMSTEDVTRAERILIEEERA